MTRNIKLPSTHDIKKGSSSECNTGHRSPNSYSLEDLRRDMEKDGVPWSIRPSMESLFIAHQNSIVARRR
jgi:hypothetical protein